MLRLDSARALRLSVAVIVLGLVSLARGELDSRAYAAGQSATTRPVTGKLQSATKHSLMLVQAGSKKLTSVLLNAKTQYIVKGKRVAKPPVFTRGSLISVMTAVTKGSYTAQIVVVSPPPLTPGVSTGPPASSSVPAPSPATSIKGAVTLTSPVSVTLQTSAGTETIKLTSATRYVVEGKPSSLKPILHAGEKVAITGVQTHGVFVGEVFTVV